MVGVDGKTLTLGFANAGARDSFDNGGSAEIVRQAAIDVVGADWRVETIVDPGASRPPARRARPPRSPGGTRATRRRRPAPAEARGPPGRRARRPAGPGSRARAGRGAERRAPARPAERRTRGDRRGRGRDPADPARRRRRQPLGQPRGRADADAHPDDPDAETRVSPAPSSSQRELGAEVIEEIRTSDQASPDRPSDHDREVTAR